VLVVGTYRDVEVDRSHPLSAALVELRRVSAVGRITLRGLSIEEVREFVMRITGHQIADEVSLAVHQRTEGNALFVEEVARHLMEAGESKAVTGCCRRSRIFPKGCAMSLVSA
jgi:predicted ATPase